MLTKRLATNLPKVFKRNIGIVAPAWQKASDPIQQLFLDKLKEYKAKGGNGKLVDPTPEIEKEKKAELDRLAKQYGNLDVKTINDFPKFKFTEPVMETKK